jgi:uncharacterized coiled-coil protein SlyX
LGKAAPYGDAVPIFPEGPRPLDQTLRPVAEVDPDLVILDKGGKPESVRYEAINAMLLNEFIKAHKRVEMQQATIAELKTTVAKQQRGIDALAVQVKEQAVELQKVNDQIKVSNPITKVALNNP